MDKSQIGNSSAAYAYPSIVFSLRALDIIILRKILKWLGECKHFCLTPTVFLNHSPVLSYI